MANEGRSKHRKALKTLSEHPEIIGLNPKEILTSSIEQIIYERGKPFIWVDLVYTLKTSQGIRIVIVEYKSNGSTKLKEKGISQLERAVDFYQKAIGIPTEGRLITGNSYPEIKKFRKIPYKTKGKRENYLNHPQPKKKKT